VELEGKKRGRESFLTILSVVRGIAT